jgi:hypothetical protein
MQGKKISYGIKNLSTFTETFLGSVNMNAC